MSNDREQPRQPSRGADDGEGLPYSVPISGFTTFTTAQGEGSLVFISGITARDEDGTIRALDDVAGQCRQIMSTIRSVLTATGGELDDVRQIRTYVLDIEAAWPAIESVWKEFWPSRFPASTLVQVARLFDERQLIETDAVAFIPARKKMENP
jgi:enamine deaminase RidA (YjgF/YER057c/UK114 family)